MKWMIQAWKERRRAVLFSIGVFAIALFLVADQAHALRVTLKRVVFEGGSRSEVITLINNTSKPQAFRMGWRRMRMTPDKALINVAEDDPAPDLNPAQKFIRFSPRRVTVKPGEAQQIRLMVRYPRDLPDGEYRSHFWIHEEAKASDFDETFSNQREKSHAVMLQMLTGITMPVFIRKGDLSVNVSIDDFSAKLAGGRIVASYKLSREGNMSAYGDMEYSCVGGTKDLSLSVVRGVAVYTEVDHRQITNRLPAPEGGLQACPKLKITFRDEGEEGRVLATQTTSIER